MSGELLVVTRRVYTLAPALAGAPPDALLVRNGRIAAVGAEEELRARAGAADVLDLRDGCVTPGLTDAHIHLLEWALSRGEPDLSACDSPEAVARVMADAAGAPRAPGAAGSGWLRGRGWNPHRWGGAYPERDVLDAVLPDRPVVLQSHDMHALWANGRALAEAGIGADTPDPEGGRIVRDARGAPTGVLLEMAAQLLSTRMPAPAPAAALAALVEAQAALHRLGITGVHSFPGVHVHEPEMLWLLGALREDDRLRLRVLQHVPLAALDHALALGLRSGFGDDWLRIGGVKVFLDGALGSRTAWLRAPYESAPGDCGVQAMDAGAFREVAARAAAGGMAVAAHAIGDAAVALALDVLGDPALSRPALPHRIEHLQLCPPEHLGEPARRGIVCSMQPAHLITDWAAAERHWGRERCRGAFAFRSLQGKGKGEGKGEGKGKEKGTGDPCAVLAFGSDAPVEPVDPRLGLFAAVARQDLDGLPEGGWFPEERLDVGSALEGYTRGPAIAGGVGQRRGFLGPGADADFVAWDVDPYTVPAAELLRMRCLATVIAGEVVWREGG